MLKIRSRNNPEAHIQWQILWYLKRLGAYCGKTRTMGVKRGKIYCFDPFTMRGKCDVEAFYKGILYGIEVKSPQGKLTADQRLYREFFHKPPDRIFIEAHSLDDVIAVIK
jgi:hypothetical protein